VISPGCMNTDGIGVVIPIMLNNLMSTHPFTKAVQYTAYLLLGCLVGGITLMRPVPKGHLGSKPHGGMAGTSKTDVKTLFESKGYTSLTIALFLLCLGVFMPSFYLQIFAVERGVDASLTSYTVAIINAASTVGTSSPSWTLLPDFLTPRPIRRSPRRPLRPPKPPRYHVLHQRHPLFLPFRSIHRPRLDPHCHPIRNLLWSIQRHHGPCSHVVRQDQYGNWSEDGVGVLDLWIGSVGGYTCYWGVVGKDGLVRASGV
jgi:hypothetical protein